MNKQCKKTVIILATLISSCGVSDTRLRINNGDPVTGQQTYANNCASCHGSQLEGQPNWRKRLPSGLLPAPPHNASGHTWHHDDLLLFEYTKFGGTGAMASRGIKDMESGMPPFESLLDDQQILDVLAFIRSTWPAEVQAAQANRNTNE